MEFIFRTALLLECCADFFMPWRRAGQAARLPPGNRQKNTPPWAAEWSECAMSNQNVTAASSRQKTRILCEGALMVAAAVALSYLKIQFLQAGSINFAMVPIIIFAVRWGVGWGVVAGAAYGTLKFFVGGGYAINWVSMVLDYTAAYGMVGMAGLCKGRKWGYPMGAFVGCLARFAVHFITGITIYKILVPTEVMGLTISNPVLFSVLYNISYMGPNTVISIATCLLLDRPLKKLPQ